METQGKRLKAVMKHYRHTQQSMGQLIGVTKGFMSVMMSDKVPVSKKVIDGIIKSFPAINLNWFLTGEGEMFMGGELIESAGSDAQVMEESSRYEPIGVGILEALMRRVARLEDEAEENRNRVEALERQVERLKAELSELRPGEKCTEEE